MAECLFCGIVRKEIASEIIYEDEGAVAFLDIHPRAPGHTVVIPRSHVATLLELSEGGVSALFLAVKKAMAALENALSPDGFTVGVNHGEASGQTVPHLHVHILPRFKGDKGGSFHSIVDNSPREPLLKIAEKIRQAQ